MRSEARFRAAAVRYASVRRSGPGPRTGARTATDGADAGWERLLTARRSGLLTVLLGVWLLTWLLGCLLAAAVPHSSGAMFGELFYGVYGGPAEGLVVGERA